jgi:hypothetical protein
MTRNRGGPSRPGEGRPTGARGQEGRGTAGDAGAEIQVRCPNPDCGTTYTVPASFAGKRARCTACGARGLIPAPTAGARSRPRDQDDPAEARPPKSARRVRGEAASRPAAEGPEVRIGCIGRGQAGKTALFHALGDSLVGDYLPSGLHLDASDPREVARLIREAEDSQRLLQRSGLPPTLEVSQTRYCVYEGDRPRVACRLREVIGQVLTHTLPDSEPRLQAQYADYLTNLVNAHVLWVVVPCPPADPGPRDRRRYANDLRISLAYLREALRLRTLEQPAAVALVLSKTDALFATPEEARAALTEDVLHRALGPLVQLIQQSDHVSDAAAFPVTAFGFGKAVLREDGAERHDAPGSSEEPFGDEPIWLLREGESPQPHNLGALLLWSLLLGLMNQTGPDAEAESDTLCRMLRDDLEASDPWLAPLKGGVTLATP